MSAAGEVSSSEKALMIVANEGYVSYALLALVIYELAVTFDQEVALVWSRRFTATSFLLLSTRWTTLLIAAIQAWNAGPHFCELSEDLVIVMYMISCLWMTGFTSLRLYALLHASKARSSLALVVATLGLIPVATNAVSRTFTTAVQSCCAADAGPQFLLAESTCQGGGSVFRRTCTRSTDIPNKTYVILLLLTRCSVLAVDLIAIAITWKKSFGHFRDMRRLRFGGVAKVLIRDGTMCFLTVLLSNTLQVLVDLQCVNLGVPYLTPVLQCLPLLLVQRFMLNLRRLNHGSPNDTQSHLRYPSQIHHTFKPSPEFLDNIGEPLDAPFAWSLDSVNEDDIVADISPEECELAAVRCRQDPMDTLS